MTSGRPIVAAVTVVGLAAGYSAMRVVQLERDVQHVRRERDSAFARSDTTLAQIRIYILAADKYEERAKWAEGRLNWFWHNECVQ